MSDPVVALLLVGHVLAAVVGFGAIGATGWYAARVRRSADPRSDEASRRYFGGGQNLVGLVLLLVPVLGGLLLARGDPADRRAVWPWIGLGLWALSITLAAVVLWPAERVIRTELAAEAPARDETLHAACARAERAAAAISTCFVVALVVMIAQPR